MKKVKRYLSVILCMTIILGAFAPSVHATQYDNSTFEITAYNNYVACYVENSEYECCAYIDSDTKSGSFSVSFTDNLDYVYEYCFTVDANSADFQTTAFWNDLLTDCFADQASWKEVYMPAAITVIENTESDVMLLASDSIVDGMISWMNTKFGTSEYTNRLTASTNIAGYNFMLYEELEYRAGIQNSYIVSQLLSVTSFILNVLKQPIAAKLVDLLSRLVGSNSIPANSNIKQYYLYAIWTRYVKRQSSGYRLSNTQRITTYDGYYVVSSNNWDVYEGSEFTEYPHSQSYFNNYSAQFTDAYNYYLNHYA